MGSVGTIATRLELQVTRLPAGMPTACRSGHGVMDYCTVYQCCCAARASCCRMGGVSNAAVLTALVRHARVSLSRARRKVRPSWLQRKLLTARRVVSDSPVQKQNTVLCGSSLSTRSRVSGRGPWRQRAADEKHYFTAPAVPKHYTT